MCFNKVAPNGLTLWKFVVNNNNISVVPYLTDKGEHTVFYKINKTAFIKENQNKILS